ncbi:MAG: hypothetical protein F6K17_25140, partial [Okeania sp. SIO3C4]|nr:hypothetical protein [Okeania sp. SIO3C4]
MVEGRQRELEAGGRRFSSIVTLYHVRLNTYTLEEVRQRELEEEAEGKKRYLREKVF